VFDVAAQATADLRGRSGDQIAQALRQTGDTSSRAETALYEQLFRSVERIVDEVLSADTLPGLTSLKSYDNYTFCHSVDVAIAALLLGQKLYLPHDRLKALGIGCVLHDIGKMAVPQDVLNKPGRLTEQEFSVVRQHPSIGYELVKAQMPDDILPKYVVLQHHERQDGAGYPHGLHGINTVLRDTRGRYESDRMLLLPEIAAVADVYDALSSDRPYRPGMAPEQIASIMRDMRAKHLNSEVLDIFLSITPRYPVGLDMVVTGGRYQGFRGVVVANNERNLDRPMVRLLVDRRGARLSPALEVSLAEEPDATISCVLEDTALAA
jgi:HD-GYP domain-containing protein (c-di-GMP phosphodiesterase class II)